MLSSAASLSNTISTDSILTTPATRNGLSTSHATVFSSLPPVSPVSESGDIKDSGRPTGTSSTSPADSISTLSSAGSSSTDQASQSPGTESPYNPSGRLPVPAIVGIVLGVAVLALLGAFLYWRHKRKTPTRFRGRESILGLDDNTTQVNGPAAATLPSKIRLQRDELQRRLQEAREALHQSESESAGSVVAGDGPGSQEEMRELQNHVKTLMEEVERLRMLVDNDPVPPPAYQGGNV